MKDEDRLFRELQEGSWKAFQAFFDAYSERLYLYASGFLCDQEEARDIVQDTFIYLWENRKEITYTGNLYSYLLRSVKNSCIDYKLHQKVKEKYVREVELLQEEAEEELVDNFEELYGRLQDIIDTLPPKCKEIFILGCVEGYSYKEVATQLAVSVNTVKTQIKVAYKKIKSELGNPDANFMVAVQSALFAGELFS